MPLRRAAPLKVNRNAAGCDRERFGGHGVEGGHLAASGGGDVAAAEPLAGEPIAGNIVAATHIGLAVLAGPSPTPRPGRAKRVGDRCGASEAV